MEKRDARTTNVRRIVLGTLSVEKMWRNQPGNASVKSGSVLYQLERD